MDRPNTLATIDHMMDEICNIRTNLRRALDVAGNFGTGTNNQIKLQSALSSLVGSLKSIVHGGASLDGTLVLPPKISGNVNDMRAAILHEQVLSFQSALALGGANSESVDDVVIAKVTEKPETIECNWLELRQQAGVASSVFESKIASTASERATKRRKIEQSPIETKIGVDLGEKFDNLDQMVEYGEKLEVPITIVKVPSSDSMSPDVLVGIKVEVKEVLNAFVSLKAIVSPMGGYIVQLDTVAVYEIEEQYEDVWHLSTHFIFQKISQHAKEALEYYANNHPGTSVQKMIQWLSYYRNLYSQPCKGCNKFLALDSDKLKWLLPSLRTFSGVACHDQCRQNQNVA